MKTITLNLFEFDELNEEAKQRALSFLCYINVEHDWWLPTYEYAERAGMKISGFDIDRGRNVDLEFVNTASEVANYINDNHSENCPTYKMARNFLNKAIELKGKTSAINALNESHFRRRMRDSYLYILTRGYRYLMTDEAIYETIKSNELLFHESGEVYEGKV